MQNDGAAAIFACLELAVFDCFKYLGTPYAADGDGMVDSHSDLLSIHDLLHEFALVRGGSWAEDAGVEFGTLIRRGRV